MGRPMVNGMTGDGIVHLYPATTEPNNGEPKTTSVRIDPDRHVVTQRGAITAALGLCPRECYRLHIGRCPVCRLLEAAARQIR